MNKRTKNSFRGLVRAPALILLQRCCLKDACNRKNSESREGFRVRFIAEKSVEKENFVFILAQRRKRLFREMKTSDNAGNIR